MTETRNAGCMADFTRRDVLKAAGVGAASLALPCFVRAQQTQARRPNIIYILADDLGYGELGCYGQTKIRTPNIDRLAAEGIRFTQHYSGSPVCAPSRCTLMTGKHTGHAYIRDNGNPPGRKNDAQNLEFPGQNPIPADTVTIAKLLKKQGYATAAIGKWGLGFEGSSGDPANQGFDLFYGYLCQVHAHNHYPRFLWRNGKKEMLEGNERGATGAQHSQDLFIREALQFIRDNQDAPFFLYLPFAIPHLSIQVPEETLNEYKGKIPEEEYEHRGYIKHPYPRAGYAAMITHMDRGIGRIMKLLADLGLDDDTLVMFCSDNGPTYDRLGGSDSEYFNSSGPLRGRKGSLYEGGVRVPLVARWPGRIAAGRTTDHISALWDVLPTLCDLAGVDPPKDIDGISFAPTLLQQRTQQRHEYLYWEFPSYGGQQAARWGNWKAIRTGCVKDPNAPVQLYNLENDIAEEHDVAAEHPELVKRAWEIFEQAHTDSDLFPFPHRQKELSALPVISKEGWKLVRVDSESKFNGKTGDKAFDGKTDTWWHTEWKDAQPGHPHEIVIDLGKPHRIRGLRYQPRTDGGINGTIQQYEFFVSDDPDKLGEPVVRGSFGPFAVKQEVLFAERSGRFVCLKSRSAIRGQPFASVAEITLLGE